MQIIYGLDGLDALVYNGQIRYIFRGNQHTIAAIAQRQKAAAITSGLKVQKAA